MGEYGVTARMVGGVNVSFKGKWSKKGNECERKVHVGCHMSWGYEARVKPPHLLSLSSLYLI